MQEKQTLSKKIAELNSKCNDYETNIMDLKNENGNISAKLNQENLKFELKETELSHLKVKNRDLDEKNKGLQPLVA